MTGSLLRQPVGRLVADDALACRLTWRNRLQFLGTALSTACVPVRRLGLCEHLSVILVGLGDNGALSR